MLHVDDQMNIEVWDKNRQWVRANMEQLSPGDIFRLVTLDGIVYRNKQNQSVFMVDEYPKIVCSPCDDPDTPSTAEMEKYLHVPLQVGKRKFKPKSKAKGISGRKAKLPVRKKKATRKKTKPRRANPPFRVPELGHDFDI